MFKAFGKVLYIAPIMHRNARCWAHRARWCGTKHELWDPEQGCLSAVAFAFQRLLEHLAAGWNCLVWYVLSIPPYMQVMQTESSRSALLSKVTSLLAVTAARLPPEGFGTFVLLTIKGKFIPKWCLLVCPQCLCRRELWQNGCSIAPGLDQTYRERSLSNPCKWVNFYKFSCSVGRQKRFKNLSHIGKIVNHPRGFPWWEHLPVVWKFQVQGLTLPSSEQELKRRSHPLQMSALTTE